MSIQPGRIVARIVEQVEREARIDLPFHAFDACSRKAVSFALPEVLEIVRVPAPAPGDDREFASLFHFWTEAACGFLTRRGEADQLRGVAGYAICETLAAPAFSATLGAELERAAGPAPATRAPEPADVREAYRMIEGSCRRSAVAATSREWIAWFWAHGWIRPAVHTPLRER